MCSDSAKNKTTRAGTLFQTWPHSIIFCYLISIPPAWVVPYVIGMLLIFSSLKRESHGPLMYLIISFNLFLLYVIINRMNHMLKADYPC
jgi:hypothetical protein